MRGEGIIPPADAAWTLNENYLRDLNLTDYDYFNDPKYHLPAWKSLTQDMLNDIVELFYQDYICFGYKPAYPKLGMSYTGKYKF